MFLGYNTNGLTHHNLFDAVELLGDVGYQGIGITIDHWVLWPESERERQCDRLRELLEQRGMRSVIETGGRFVLDPQKKHEPTLLSADRRRRVDFYRYAIDCAATLGSDCVSIWSGVLREKISEEEAVARLAEGLRETLNYAAEREVAIAFEPEPGMLIDTTARFEELLKEVDADNLRITLDIGHLHCQGEVPIAEVIRRWAPRLGNVHIEDMRTGTHEHLMFGDGEIDFAPVLAALAAVGYDAGVYVELSRHSHEGPQAAREAFAFLEPILNSLAQ